MASKVTSITSMDHFRKVTDSSTYTVVDFYADWCGPCKVIAPILEQLAQAETKPGRIVFAKVNVDNQRDVASMYGISAMPTFLILKGRTVKETVRGANPAALRTAVLSAAADAAKAPGRSSASFSGSGHTLGSGTGGSKAPTARSSFPPVDFSGMLANPAHFAQGSGFLSSLVRFLGLYVTSFFSFEPLRSAEQSPFSVKNNNAGRRVR